MIWGEIEKGKCCVSRARKSIPPAVRKRNRPERNIHIRSMRKHRAMRLKKKNVRCWGGKRGVGVLRGSGERRNSTKGFSLGLVVKKKNADQQGTESGGVRQMIKKSSHKTGAVLKRSLP